MPSFVAYVSCLAEHARALYKDQAASLDHLSEAVTALEETERVAKRVLGGAHPQVAGIGEALRYARAALRAREMFSGMGQIH